MKKFRVTLTSSNSTAKEVLAAIKGYGKFAEVWEIVAFHHSCYVLISKHNLLQPIQNVWIFI